MARSSAVFLGGAFVLFATLASLVSLHRQLQKFDGLSVPAETAKPINAGSDSQSESSSPSHHQQRPLHRVIPLIELVDTNRETNCTPPLVRINDTIAPDFKIDYKKHIIPKIVHVTSKSRCMTQLFADNLEKWRFQGEWSFFFHDDEAMDRLLNHQQHWPMFPQVSESVKCMVSGAAKSDLWRGLVLWEYGGVYTDIDNGPNKFNGDYPVTDEDSLFVVERIGVLSQYFMAASPRHPLMHQLVLSVMHRLYKLSEVSKQYAPVTTGPGALKEAFIHFMHAMSTWDNWSLANPTAIGLYHRVESGTYWGLGNRSVTVVGRKAKSQEYVVRESIRGKDKRASYRQMGMKHFNDAEKSSGVGLNVSCFNHLYDQIDWSVYNDEENERI